MKRFLWPTIAISCLLAGVAIGAALGYSRWYRVSKRPYEVRMLVIEHHAAEMPKGGTIILGDSLVERQRLDDLCGPTLNAGAGGAQVIDLAPSLPKLLELTKARQVAFEVGTNDLYYKVPIPRFIERYRAMVRSAAPARVIIVGIPGDFDEANRALKKLAEEESARFVEGFKTAGLTTDGVHFNAAGGAHWREKLRVTCTS